jgi:hypothetical protein
MHPDKACCTRSWHQVWSIQTRPVVPDHGIICDVSRHGLLYQPSMIFDDERGAVSGTSICRRNQSIQRKPPVLLCPSHIIYNVFWGRIRAISFDTLAINSHVLSTPDDRHMSSGFRNVNWQGKMHCAEETCLSETLSTAHTCPSIEHWQQPWEASHQGYILSMNWTEMSRSVQQSNLFAQSCLSSRKLE